MCKYAERQAVFLYYYFVDSFRTLRLSQRKQDQTEKKQTLTGKDNSLHHLYKEPFSKTQLVNIKVQHTMFIITIISINDVVLTMLLNLTNNFYILKFNVYILIPREHLLKKSVLGSLLHWLNWSYSTYTTATTRKGKLTNTVTVGLSH